VKEITTYRNGTIDIVEASGEVDMSNVDGMDKALKAALSKDASSCLLDMCAVEFADSTVIQALIRWSNDAQLSSREALAIVVAHDSPVARLLDLVGLTTKLPIFASREAATTALLEGQRARDKRQLEWLTDAELHTARTDAQAASDSSERRLDDITAEEQRRDG
jgi:anti-anti-sigma factor